MAEHTNSGLAEVAFTYRWYRDFLERLRARGLTFRGFDRPPTAGEVVLRHDVDLSLEAAARMARLEADLGVQATYCVLLTSRLYNPLDAEMRDLVGEIDSLGHDVALHFSTHEYWDAHDPPTAETIERRVDEEREILGTIVDEPETVSFHIPPEWVQGRTFAGFRNTYAPGFFDDATYVADSTQRWRGDPPRVDELSGPLQVLTHPGLWGDRDDDFEGRIDDAIERSCRRTRRAALAEFVDGVYD